MVIRYEKGEVAHKLACIVYPDKQAVEIQRKGHKLLVIFFKGSFVVKEY